MYDILIVGGGPAAVAAGIYSSRKKLKTILITDILGGQSVVSDSIENWIGEKAISGYDLAKKLEDHIRAQEDIVIKVGEKAKSSKVVKCGFEIKTDKGNKYVGKTLMIASGARRRKLGVQGEEKYDGKGVAYCSTCDAPLFKNKTVVVVGGGNSGLEAVVDLAPYAKKIYLLNLGGEVTGDPITGAEVKKIKKAKIINNAQVVSVEGDKSVEKIKYRNVKGGGEKELKVDGVFVEIGSVPNSDWVKDLVGLNQYGEVIVDPRTGAATVAGVYAAGDVSDDIYKQNNIAVGDAVKSALSAYNYILNFNKKSPAADCK